MVSEKIVGITFHSLSIGRRSAQQLAVFLLTVLTSLALLSGIAQADIRFSETTSGSNFDKTESWGASWAFIDDDPYPDLFVGNHRSKISIFKNRGDGTFENITDYADPGKTFSGVDNSGPGGTPFNKEFTDTHGTAFADVDGDDDQDFITITSLARPGILMLNNGSGQFTNATTDFGFEQDFEGRTPHWVDYDNDGMLDLLMTSGTVSLFRNSGPGQRWQEVAEPTLLRAKCQRDQWFMLTDMDNQPGMEYVCGKEGNWPGATLDFRPGGNAGGGTFVEDPYLPMWSLSHATDSVAADFDGDLDPDLFVTRGAIMPSQAKLITPTRLESWMWTGTNSGLRTVTFKATGRLTFEVHSNQTGQASLIQIGARGRNPPDDGDGNILRTRFVLDSTNTDNQGLFYEGRPQEFFKTSFAKRTFIGHDGNGNWTVTLSPGDQSVRALFTVDAESSDITDLPNTFTGVINSTNQDTPLYPGLLFNTGTGYSPNQYSSRVGPGPAEKQMCVSVVAADFDNDMDVDIYMVCRGGVENIRNVLLENDGRGNFQEMRGHGAEGGIGAGINSGWAQGESVVTADYDLDGFLDLFVTNGIVMQPLRRGGQDQLFRNTTNNGNSWVQLLLKGEESNIEGIGAQVKVTANGKTQLREQNDGMHRWSQNLKQIHFGLGSASRFDIEITWPSGTVDRFTGMRANEFYDFVEGSPNAPQPRDRPGGDRPTNTLSSRVSQSVDDAMQNASNNSMVLDGNVLNVADANTPRQVGMIFRDIDIEKGSEIISAHIEFNAGATSSSTAPMQFSGHATHYTGIFKPLSNNIGFRARTSARVSWNNVGAWTAGESYWSKDIRSIVQEVVDIPRWAAGNPVAILVEQNANQGQGIRTATSYDQNPGTAPRLIVKWR